MTVRTVAAYPGTSMRPVARPTRTTAPKANDSVIPMRPAKLSNRMGRSEKAKQLSSRYRNFRRKDQALRPWRRGRRLYRISARRNPSQKISPMRVELLSPSERISSRNWRVQPKTSTPPRGTCRWTAAR